MEIVSGIKPPTTRQREREVCTYVCKSHMKVQKRVFKFPLRLNDART